SIIAPGHKYFFFPVLHDSSLIDIDWELDCMYGVTCLTEAQADYIEDRFLLEGIRAHIDIDETNICQAHGVINPVVAWTDPEAETLGDLDDESLDECDDWRSITLNHFGTPNERTTAAGTGQGTGSGTLVSGNGELKLKRLVTRYLLMTYNTNNEGVTACGTTGIAMLGGMNAIVSVQCLLDTALNEVSPAQIILGTVMHEQGHTYGLKHGGTDDINCKINYRSPMNYIGQMPTTLMPVKLAGATTQYGWYGDYSHGRFLYQTGAGAPVGGDQNKIVENSLTDSNKLIVSGTWKEANGVKMSVDGDPSTLATVTQFKTLWSDTTPGAAANPKSGYAATTLASATSINWNGISGISNPYQDLNYLTVKVGDNKQFPACTQSKDPTNLVSPQSDYLTIAQKVALSNNDATDQLGLSAFGLGDPDHDPEMNLQTYEAFNSVSFKSPGVQPPLNNVGFGDPNLSLIKKGSTVNVKLDIFDDEGIKVTDANALSVYQIEKIDLTIALIDAGIPPDDDDYFFPTTSNQPGAAYFKYDGSKWSFTFGTKNLVINGEYAARIQIKFTTGEIYILDNRNDDVDNISFVFKMVKG
ncbi:MAG: hypothetical protein ACRD5H_08880, partial [Nitrososphaerales archaeon]